MRGQFVRVRRGFGSRGEVLAGNCGGGAIRIFMCIAAVEAVIKLTEAQWFASENVGCGAVLVWRRGAEVPSL